MGANASQDILILGMGFVAFGANVRIPSGGPGVSMMQPTNLRNDDHLALGWTLDSAWHGRIAFQREMRA